MPTWKQLAGILRKNPYLKNTFYLIFILLEILSGYRRERRQFLAKRGYLPNLKNPETFCEKVVWKKIHDRNPLLRVTADKYQVRSHICNLLGAERAAEILIPLLHVTDQPETIPFDALPDSYIVKANHGSGWNLIVEQNSRSREEILAACRRWLKAPYGLFKHEWAYWKIERKIIIEPLLKDKSGKLPGDFKFFVFHNRCRLIRVFMNRFSGLEVSTFRPDWTFLPETYRKQGRIIEKPPNYETMLALAEELSTGLDFVRVDLYNVDGKIYFGEMTHYPSSGAAHIHPLLDRELGRYWQIKPGYWKVGKPKAAAFRQAISRGNKTPSISQCDDLLRKEKAKKTRISLPKQYFGHEN